MSAVGQKSGAEVTGGDPALLTRWIVWFTRTLVILGLFFLVLYLVLRSPASLIISGLMLLLFLPAALYGVRTSRQGRAGPALAAMAFCSWALALLVAARGHTALPASLPLVLLPMIFALPYVSRRALLVIALAALAVAAAASALTIAPPLLASRIDEHTLAIIMVPIIVVSTALAIFGLWYVGSALRSSLQKTESINLRLESSERELERQVETRTAELRKAVSELSDIDAISRAVNVTLELDDVISAMHAALQGVLHFDSLSVLLLDEQRQRLMVDHIAGIDLNTDWHRKILEEGVPATDDNSVFSYALARKQPVLAADIGEAQLGAMSSLDKLLYEVDPVKSLLICPLEFAGESIGVLTLARKHETMSLSPDEVSRIQRYIAPLAVVIRNAHLLKEAEAARADALESSRAKSQFLANMSHELRTPLNAIIGYCELLAEDAEEAGDDQYFDDLEKIRSSGKYLLELIRGVLDLTRIEAGKLELTITEFEVADLMRELAQTAAPFAERQANRLETRLSGDPGTMHSDMGKVRQLLFNLLDNACKFTHDGQIEFEARRDPQDGGDNMIFRVTDNGIGMNPEQQERIFEPFTQADESAARRYGGTGLGLTISREFSEFLGGWIEVSSEEGSGSTFTVTLPARVSRDGDQPR